MTAAAALAAVVVGEVKSFFWKLEPNGLPNTLLESGDEEEQFELHLQA